VLSRAEKILSAVRAELARHDKALEIDDGISKIELTVVMSLRTGDPVKVIYGPVSERDLTRGP
jgi:hypothetical protein